MEQTVSGRMGGRNARKAKRAAELPENMKPLSYTHLTLPTILLV